MALPILSLDDAKREVEWKEETMYLPCGCIAERFKAYCVATTRTQLLNDLNENDEDLDTKKAIYASVLRCLYQYSDDELHAHYKGSTREWRDWCNDVALYFMYHAMLFGKGIPSVEVSEEARKNIH